jgi:hypothetical protein
MKKTYERRLERFVDRLSIEETKLLFLTDEIKEDLDELSAGQTVGIEGERLVLISDNINVAEDSLAQAIYYLKQAKNLFEYKPCFHYQ